MPIHVDVHRRRAEIAEATFRVAARHGLSGVTIRSVAAELGASTTVITNYLPTRADLLVNAMRRMTDYWLAELGTRSEGLSATAALREVMRTTVSWDQDELVRCQFWIAVLATQPEQVREEVGEVEDAVRDLLAKLIDQCGHPEPAPAADQLFLFAQGVFASVVEMPSRWTVDRLQRAADLAVDGVLAAANAG